MGRLVVLLGLSLSLLGWVASGKGFAADVPARIETPFALTLTAEALPRYNAYLPAMPCYNPAIALTKPCNWLFAPTPTFVPTAPPVLTLVPTVPAP